MDRNLKTITNEVQTQIGTLTDEINRILSNKMTEILAKVQNLESQQVEYKLKIQELQSEPRGSLKSREIHRSI